ncbi:type III secretion protein L [Mesorhizobium sp. J18]|uniref:type III secretion system stator protein SctL n=1 Tax=Mesorhizobium sp. J18 TaxID=935263 RepID=UPI00119AD3C1|nr:type III secretion system stator protein SctL [Mesorhizobium sp. J18]TWG99545.1 type III secretion protein L [Mesorhizobium sp. J18]
MARGENEPLHDLLPTRPACRILRPAEAQAWQEGFAFLDAARSEARRTQEAARQAYAREYAQGYEDGKAAGEAEAARLVSETVVKVDRYLEGIEKDVVSLALDIVKRVLGDLDVEKRVALAARKQVADIRRAKYIRVTTHPDVVTEVKKELDELAAEGSLACSVEIDGDNSVAPHACIVATDLAVFDASVEAQIAALAAAIGKDAEAGQ